MSAPGLVEALEALARGLEAGDPVEAAPRAAAVLSLSQELAANARTIPEEEAQKASGLVQACLAAAERIFERLEGERGALADYQRAAAAYRRD